MQKNNIIILSEPVRSGKTTALLNWINSNDNVDGILSPDINNMRKLLFIRDLHLMEFETLKEQDIIEVGRFKLLKKSFDNGNEYLKNIVPVASGNIIIDEIGKLELNEMGFYDGLVSCLNCIKNSEEKFNLILVVRDTLLQAVIEKFNLHDATVISKKELDYTDFSVLKNNISGLVLCGGKSTRMGVDKAFLNYHGTEQYKYVADLFEKINLSVFISCNSKQQVEISSSYETITDNEEYNNSGPVAGLLSAFKIYNTTSFIVAGCDYPHVNSNHINQLLSLSRFGFDAVCFVSNETPNLLEPLLTYYHFSCADKLTAYYNNGNTSLNKFLSTIKTIKIVAEDNLFLKSYDSQDDFKTFVL